MLEVETIYDGVLDIHTKYSNTKDDFYKFKSECDKYIKKMKDLKKLELPKKEIYYRLLYY